MGSCLSRREEACPRCWGTALADEPAKPSDGAEEQGRDTGSDSDDALVGWLSVVFTRADWAPEAPIAYGIDFGVTDVGATLLVEVNEGFSLGCYGLGPLADSGFLAARGRELVAPGERVLR